LERSTRRVRRSRRPLIRRDGIVIIECSPDICVNKKGGELKFTFRAQAERRREKKW